MNANLALPALQFALPVPFLGTWRAGNTGIEGVWVFEGSAPGPNVVVTSLIHGNEISGAWAVLGLLEHGVRPLRGSLTLMFCNLTAFDRFDAADPDATRFVEEDLNRVWGVGGGSASLERRRAAELRPFIDKADFLLDLHSMHEPGDPLVLTGVLPRNLAFARAVGLLGHIVVDAGHAEGVRLRDARQFGEPYANACALLVESGYHGDLSSRAVAYDSVRRFLRACGNIDTRPLETGALAAQWQLPPVAHALQVEVTHPVIARSMNFRFAQNWAGLQVIERAGTLIAVDDGNEIRTPYDDCVLVMPSLRQLRVGVTVVRLARKLST